MKAIPEGKSNLDEACVKCDDSKLSLSDHYLNDEHRTSIMVSRVVPR